MKLFKWIYDILFTTRLIRSNIIVCDIDKTIGYIKPSSFEDDGDLEKWKQDNTLMEQLIPLCETSNSIRYSRDVFKR